MINDYILNGLIIFLVLYSSFSNFNLILSMFNNKIFKLILILLLIIFYKINNILCLSYIILIFLLYENYNENKNKNKKRISDNIIINSILYSNLKNIK